MPFNTINLLLKRGRKTSVIFLLTCLFQSCGESSLEKKDIQPVTTISSLRTRQEKLDGLVLQVTSSKHLRNIVNEALLIRQLQKSKKVKINRINNDDLSIKLSNCRSEEDYRKVVASVSSDPDEVMKSIKRMYIAFQDLDTEIHFSDLSDNEKKDLFAKSVKQFQKENLGNQASTADGQSVQMLDCGGLCNTAYARNMDNAAQALIIATGVSWAAGIIGGPSGMAAGAVGIAGAVITYWVMTNLYLDQLGDCFAGCAPGTWY